MSWILCLLVLLAECSPATPEVDTEQIEVTRLVETEVTWIFEVPVEVTRLVEVEVTRVVAPTPTPRPSATATTDGPEIGTRENPVPMVTPDDAAITTDAGRQSATFTVLDIIHGDEAHQVGLSANSFNDPPTAGKEFLLALVEIVCHEGEGVLEIGRHDTAIVSYNRTIDFGDISFDVPCCLEPEFDFQLFPDQQRPAGYR